MKLSICLGLLLLIGLPCKGQFLTVKVDGLSALAAQVDAGIDVAISPKMSVEVGAVFSIARIGTFPLLRPAITTGLKYWFYETTAGHYVTLHYNYGQYLRKPTGKKNKGRYHGAGISYGYQWLLNERMNWFVEGGVGISRIREVKKDTNPESDRDIMILHSRKLVLHPSRVSLGFSYLF